MTKEEIIEAYYALRKELRKAPTGEEFHRLSPVPRREVIKKFRTYGDLMRSAGDTPYKFKTTLYRDEDFLHSYGEFIRKHKRRPSHSDWLYHNIKPHYESYRKRFKRGWAEMPSVFYERKNNPKDRETWGDTLRIIEEKGMLAISSDRAGASRRKQLKRLRADDLLARSLPPIYHNVIELCYGDEASRNLKLKCGAVMEGLGYEVLMLDDERDTHARGVTGNLAKPMCIRY